MARRASGIEAKKDFQRHFASESQSTVNISSHQSKTPARPADDQAMKGTLGQDAAIADNPEIFVLHLAFAGEETGDTPALGSWFVEGIITEPLGTEETVRITANL